MSGPEAHLMANSIHFAVVDTMKHIVIVSLRTHCQPTHFRIIWNWRLRNWLDYEPKLVRTKYDVCLVKEDDVEASLEFTWSLLLPMFIHYLVFLRSRKLYKAHLRRKVPPYDTNPTKTN